MLASIQETPDLRLDARDHVAIDGITDVDVLAVRNLRRRLLAQRQAEGKQQKPPQRYEQMHRPEFGQKSCPATVDPEHECPSPGTSG